MAAEWQIGDRIQNRWEIHRILKGGMGIVYVVYDHDWHEPFAVKTFQDELFAQNSAIADLFTDEALVWIGLDVHQNITQARLVQKIENKPFLFLEYVSGGDLSGWIGTPRLTEDLSKVLLFAVQFCDGMTYAVAKGIKAHRDIKPQNCLVTEDGTLKITDFGLAKVLDDVSLSSSGQSKRGASIGLSRTGKGAGTCTHMAPEQFDDAKHVDVRSDVYSFGVMLFQMVTGKLPFSGRTWQELERLHKSQALPSFSVNSSSFKVVVEKCLAKDPAQRYADFFKLRNDLAQIYEGLVGDPAPQPATGKTLVAEQYNNKGVSLKNLDRPAEALECYDRAIEITAEFAGAWANKGVALKILERYREAEDCYDRALKLTPDFGEVLTNKANLLQLLRKFDDAIGYYDRALKLNPLLEQAWSNKGETLRLSGKHQEAIGCYERALQLNQRDSDNWTGIGLTYADLGRHEQALSSYDHSLTLNPQQGRTWANKAVSLRSLRRPEESLQASNRALDLDHSLAEAWSTKGNALHDLGRLQEAITCYDRSLELNPRKPLAWCNKGEVLRLVERYDEAAECYRQALALDPNDAEAWHGGGAVYLNMGEYENAFAYCERALEINPRLETAWSNKGAILLKWERYPEAVACFDHSLAVNPNFAGAWFNRGMALLHCERLTEGLASFQEAERLGFSQAGEVLAIYRQTFNQ
ncbi:MAG TPA: tetratricopeptide repeat protein [Pyrinomonadaceae bacterium]|nr:tetratricopeptide repeat protein [Pyrinomonadaceae bacterium]